IDDYHQAMYDTDSELTCSIRTQWTDNDTGTTYEVGVSNDGASCLIKKEEGRILQKGDFAIVRATGEFHNEQFICEYVSKSDASFNVGYAVNYLMKAISKSEELEEDVLDDTMELDAVNEIIGILDRQSVISETRSVSYSYVALAAILSKIVGDTTNTAYYEKRKKIIVATEEYERNGYVDDQKLSNLLESIGNDLIQTDYQINDAVTKFRILQSLRHKDNVRALLDISMGAKNPSVKNAADLAISLLLTDRFDIPNISRMLQDRIYHEIGVKVKTSKLRDFGIETQTQEFKSSMVFPPDNGMKPNKTVQGANILKVICSFLNSDEGGTLYFGVNKNGASCGVDSDLKYLETDEDGYGRYIHGLIHKELGPIANQCCTKCHWEEDGGYKIYVMNIAPSPELIKYNGDCWVRQDTEKRILHESKVAAYEKMHETAYEKYIATAPKEVEKTETNIVVDIHPDEPKQEIKSANLNTSKWRTNIVQPWEEDCGIETAAFVHFLTNWKYKVTDDAIYEETELSLAIHDNEADGFMVVGYESGNILVVNMEDIMAKTRNKKSSRSQIEEPIFACPAKKNDGVLSVWRSTQGDLMVRVDTYDDLVEQHCDGTLTDSGAPIHDTKNKGVVLYEVVPENVMPQFLKYRNKGLGLGLKLTSKDKQMLQSLLKVEL
ncbi:MAG: ATP-binding protein, partial [Bacteroidaceae bacterium]|nr:ATP-binding protein [Bacteroidaceae bacterium]